MAKSTSGVRKPAARRTATRKPVARKAAPRRTARVTKPVEIQDDPFAHLTTRIEAEQAADAAFEEEAAPRPTRAAGRPAEARVHRAPVRADATRGAQREQVDPNRMTRNRRRRDAPDVFRVAKSTIPEGSSYEWKSIAVKGKPSDSHQVNLRENGWRPVPASRHPELLPNDYKGSAIIKDEMMLMERPSYLTDEAKQEDYELAREQVLIKEQALSDTPSGTFTRAHPSARAQTGIRVTHEPMAVPD